MLAFLGALGPAEIAVLVILVMVLFGAKRLPELGRSLGQGLKEFRRSLSGALEDDPTEQKPGEETTKSA